MYLLNLTFHGSNDSLTLLKKNTLPFSSLGVSEIFFFTFLKVSYNHQKCTYLQ